MRFSSATLVAVALACVHAAGCANMTSESTAPALPKPARTQLKQAPAVPAFHWEPLDVSVDPSIEREPLPLSEPSVTLLGKTRERLALYPQAARDALWARGFVVLERPDAPAATGAFYRELDEREVPMVLTVDALTELTHVALEAALAGADAVAIEPSVRALLGRFAKRFDALAEGAPTDLLRPLRMVRGIVAVALALLDDATPPADLAADVRDETRRVREGFAKAPSVVLGLPIDYRAIAVASADSPRRNVADAMGWLAAAPLLLLGRDGERNWSTSVALARDHARAALLFAHAVHPKVDAEAAREMTRVEAIETFLVGSADDWSPPELAELATREGFDLLQPRSFVDVARIDRLRRNAASTYRARVHDGSGSLFPMMADLARDDRENKFVSRFVVGTSRVFGPRVALDAIVQQALVTPVVGRFRGNRTVVTLREGRRALSRPLDFMAVLGSEEAREVLRAEGDDAYEEFEGTLRKLVSRRPPELEATRHASVYLSELDLVASLLAPSAADASLPASADREYRKRMLEAALAAYVAVRHDFGRRARALPRVATLEEAPRPTTEESRGHAPRIYVEPHPEAIGRMVALVRQVSRGLAAYRALDPDSASSKIVATAERLLTTAFQAALLMANGLPPSDEQSRALAQWAHSLGALERATDNRAARAVDMHFDLASERALAQGTGKLAEIALVIRDPRDGKSVVAFGTSATHHELVHARSEALSDRDWRERVTRGSLPRASWTNTFRVAVDAK